MADEDLTDDELTVPEEDGAEEEPRKKAGDVDSGGILRIVLLIVPLAFVAAALAALFWMPGDKEKPGGGETRIIQDEPARPLIASSRAERIKQRREDMRYRYRSSHNQHLAEGREQRSMVWIASQGELVLLSGLFDHYFRMNARMHEFYRLMANDYIEEREQVKEIFERKLLTEFRNTERRRRYLRRRITHQPALELYDDLDYIAYHDSSAVYSFDKFLDTDETEYFDEAISRMNSAKFMLKEFWNYFKLHLDSYEVDYTPPEQIWNRYYAPWWPE